MTFHTQTQASAYMNVTWKKQHADICWGGNCLLLCLCLQLSQALLLLQLLLYLECLLALLLLLQQAQNVLLVLIQCLQAQACLSGALLAPMCSCALVYGN